LLGSLAKDSTSRKSEVDKQISNRKVASRKTLLRTVRVDGLPIFYREALISITCIFFTISNDSSCTNIF
jgi:hypothetical protein